jgi:hypothetical protein
VLTPALEQGAQTYFAINFQRGDKLNDKGYAIVLERMREVHDNCVEVDMARANRIVKDSTTTTDIQVEPTATDDDALPPHMTEDINPDDIPF